MPMPMNRNRIFPAKEAIAEWVMLLREASWMDVSEMLEVEKALHKTFGAEPSEAVLDGERELAKTLRSYGIEHRYEDELAKTAGTYVENKVEPSLEEVRFYLQPMTVHSGAVKLMQGVENESQIYISVSEKTMPGMKKTIRKTVNRMLPNGVTSKENPKVAKEEFAREMEAYDLLLVPTYKPVSVVPWPVIKGSAPESVFKSDKIQITVQQIIQTQEVVLKEGEDPERYVLGPVLIPEQEDAQGEIYSKEEVRKACHWWAENSGMFSHRHVMQGGEALDDGEMVMLENFLMPATTEINGVVIKEGTWMLGAGIRNDELWRKAISGQLRSWSIGAEALSWIEEAPA